MTNVTTSSAREQTPPDLSQILSRLDAWISAMEKAGYSQPSEMPQVVRHLEAIADQTQRMADAVTTPTAGPETLAALTKQMSQLEVQNTALLEKMDQLHDRMDLLCDWLGEKPHPAAAQT